MAKKRETVGGQHADALDAAIRDFAAAPLPGSRDLFVFTDLKPRGGFFTTQENAIVTVSEYLRGSKRVFSRGNSIVMEYWSSRGPATLVPLSEDGAVLAGAEHRLANLIVCDSGSGQFSLPRGFVELLLRAETLRDALPAIKTYALRPVYDDHFVLRGPGWHPEVSILVHGPDVASAAWEMPRAGLPAIERLPIRLKTLLGGFCFRADADVANAIALLLTVLLVSRYVRDGKPLILVDGNQSSVGKSILARIIGVVADDADPPLMPYTPNEEELRKSILAHLRESSGSLVVLDNAKVAAGAKLESPVLEALSSAAELALRVLGTSTLFRRPNDQLWIVTMNHTRASDDLLRRGLPIRLEYEGNPESRHFVIDPVSYAFSNRLGILAELLGMIDHWTAAGRPQASVSHRFRAWAAEVGGILNACGFPEFLGNFGEATSEFSAESEDLSVLAEHVLAKGGPGLAPDPARPKAKALTAKEWVPLFLTTKLLDEDLAAAKNAKSRETRVGQFLAKSVGKQIRVQSGDKTTTLTLRSRPARANAKVYWFDVELDSVAPSDPPVPGDPPAAKPDAPATPPGTRTMPISPAPIGNNETWVS